MSNESNDTNKIQLTAEQLINFVGHTAIQEQLDNVRRELDSKIDRVWTDLNSKIDKLDIKSEDRFRIVDAKIDSLKTSLLMGVITLLIGAVAATTFIVSHFPA